MIERMDEAIARRRRALNVRMFVGAILLFAGPFLGLIGSVIGTSRSFEKIESMKSPTPADLAEGVRSSLIFSGIGLVVAVVGVVLLVVSIIPLISLNKAQPGPPAPR